MLAHPPARSSSTAVLIRSPVVDPLDTATATISRGGGGRVVVGASVVGGSAIAYGEGGGANSGPVVAFDPAAAVVVALDPAAVAVVVSLPAVGMDPLAMGGVGASGAAVVDGAMVDGGTVVGATVDAGGAGGGGAVVGGEVDGGGGEVVSALAPVVLVVSTAGADSTVPVVSRYATAPTATRKIAASRADRSRWRVTVDQLARSSPM
jgi:hypothetical protein